MSDTGLHIVFDGPPGPQGGRFVEVEDDDGFSRGFGKWSHRDDGLWSLRITPEDFEGIPDPTR